MGLFDKKSIDTLGAPEMITNLKSGTTTVVPSQNVSSTDLDRHSHLGDTKEEKRSSTASTDGEKSLQTDHPSKSMDEKLGTTLIDAPPTISDSKASSIVETTNEEARANPTTPDDDEIEYPGGLKLVLITLALCLAVFLVALDNTIIATAIPKITDRFNSLGDVGWYGSSYLLTTCALQLFFGK
jgi:hypothetical protein